MNIKLLLAILISSSLLFACSQGADSPKGFSLPKGDAVKGELAFKKHKCVACHSVEGFEDESVKKEFERPIQLGVTSSIVKTYGQLVTSVINPSHKIAGQAIGIDNIKNPDGTSAMPIYNDVMTVNELIDIVTYLQPKYKVKPMRYTQYQQYYNLN
ncbi:c-type cytochrome [Glaciecola sp. MF2-115]|uniref:c-type cytochrome n=1 Tax=Glaciecola sp. MF2-115 TaxID=3384827 RepID=UPI0039A297B7